MPIGFIIKSVCILALIGMCSATLAYAAYGMATESWMLFVIIGLNLFAPHAFVRRHFRTDEACHGQLLLTLRYLF